jgi:hypothetical protein
MHRLALAAVVLSACTLPEVVPDALKAEYAPTGEVSFSSHGATFDQVRVRNPHSNLAKRTDESWGGTLGDRAIDVSVTNDAIRGVNFKFTREEPSPGKTIITGQFESKIYRFELSPEQALVRSPSMSFTFPGRTEKDGQVFYGPRNDLTLKGEAGHPNPPWPQIAFALVAAFY